MNKVDTSDPMSFVPCRLRKSKDIEEPEKLLSLAQMLSSIMKSTSINTLLYSKDELNSYEILSGPDKLDDKVIFGYMSDLQQDEASKIAVLKIISKLVVKADQNEIENIKNILNTFGLSLIVINFLNNETNEELLAQSMNILCLLSNCLQLSESAESSLISKVIEHIQDSSPSLSKKCLCFLALYFSNIADFKNIRMNQLTYNQRPSSSISTSFDSGKNVTFLMVGCIPEAYILSEDITKKYTIDLESSKYFNTGEVIEACHNERSRSILKILYPHFKSILSSIQTILIERSSFIKDSQAIPEAEQREENDEIVFMAWVALYSILELLNQSHFLDSDLFGEALASTDIPKLASITVMHYRKEVFDGSACYTFGTDSYNISDLSFAVMFRVLSCSVASYPWRVGRFVNETSFSSLFPNINEFKNPLMIREAAYLLSRCVRWLPRIKDHSGFTGFIYTNLKEFELFERCNNDPQYESTSPISQEKHTKNIANHIQAIGLVI